MGLFSNRAAEQLFIQGGQPVGQQAGAMWVNSGTTPNPELRIFDGSDWNQQDPVGAIIPWGGPVSSIPSGFLLCDNSAVSRTTFSTLFSAIGTRYGVGDGSTTFNLPDLRGKFPRGAGDGNDGGATGGEDTHTLTEAELAVHDHVVTDPGHSHIVRDLTAGSSLRVPLVDGGAGNKTTLSATTGITVNDAGSGDAHENKPKFQEVLWIVKT